MRADEHTSGYGGVVATPHPLSTQAGIDMLDSGGNAVDAAVAACAVQGVVAPETCGVGGDLFALVHVPGQPRPLALNASGRAGSGVDAAALRAAGHVTIPGSHPAAIPVPGCVDGWMALLDRLGRRTPAEVLHRAVQLAADGFPASDDLVRAVRSRVDALQHQQAARPLLAATHAGARVVRRELAATLRAVADGGRAAFYESAAGAAITAATGGVITADDLHRNQADWVEALGVDVWGTTAWTVPPNSQGYLATGTCAVLERLGLTGGISDPLSWHVMIEAYRALAAGRDDVVVDPQRPTMPADHLLAPDRLDAVAASVDRAGARDRPAPIPASGGTAYLCVVDADGLGVSLIQSNFRGIGSGVGAGSAGFLLHDRGLGFTLEAGHPGELAPGRRPLHTLAPTLWTREQHLRLLLGTRGGHVQPQIVAQMAAAVLADGADPATAQHRPRWTVEVPPTAGCRVRLEPGVPDEVSAGLRQLGHDVTVLPDRQPGWGPVSLIAVDDSGRRTTSPDPRVVTTSVAHTPRADTVERS